MTFYEFIKIDDILKNPHAPWGTTRHENGIFMASKKCPLWDVIVKSFGFNYVMNNIQIQRAASEA